jgi:hypothetical protein
MGRESGREAIRTAGDPRKSLRIAMRLGPAPVAHPLDELRARQERARAETLRAERVAMGLEDPA